MNFPLWNRDMNTKIETSGSDASNPEEAKSSQRVQNHASLSELDDRHSQARGGDREVPPPRGQRSCARRMEGARAKEVESIKQEEEKEERETVPNFIMHRLG
ncbi:hypothetical protein EYF80_053064 [Liparis tanakae]|uniref:Uncharacterized protein n=1 Tax=Liparis tanakae TaxID=230148 RepID=A0A4Z2F6H7_9TELE|nr:hypothetical protein EYF80_053064 [Liparis tanakae]